MQRQDSYLINRNTMLATMAAMLSLAGEMVRLAASGERVNEEQLYRFHRIEQLMLVVLWGILANVDTSRLRVPVHVTADSLAHPGETRPELLRLAASCQQLALSLACILALNPRAFRDRRRDAEVQRGDIVASSKTGVTAVRLRSQARANLAFMAIPAVACLSRAPP